MSTPTEQAAQDAILRLETPEKVSDGFTFSYRDGANFSGPVFAVLGPTCAGKSYLFNRLTNSTAFMEGDAFNTQGLVFKSFCLLNKNVVLMDSVGNDQKITMTANYETQYRDRMAKDLFVRNTIVDLADSFIYVANSISFQQQQDVQNYAEAVKQKRVKTVYVVHNFRSCKSFQEMNDSWAEVVDLYGHLISQNFSENNEEPITYLGSHLFNQRHFYIGCEDPNKVNNPADLAKIKVHNERVFKLIRKMFGDSATKVDEVDLKGNILHTCSVNINACLKFKPTSDSEEPEFEDRKIDLAWKEGKPYKDQSGFDFNTVTLQCASVDPVMLRPDFMNSMNSNLRVHGIEVPLDNSVSAKFPFPVNIKEYSDVMYVMEILSTGAKTHFNPFFDPSVNGSCAIQVTVVDDNAIQVTIRRSNPVIAYPDSKNRVNMDRYIAENYNTFNYQREYSKKFLIPEAFAIHTSDEQPPFNALYGRIDELFENGLLRISFPHKGIVDLDGVEAYVQAEKVEPLYKDLPEVTMPKNIHIKIVLVLDPRYENYAKQLSQSLEKVIGSTHLFRVQFVTVLSNTPNLAEKVNSNDPRIVIFHTEHVQFKTYESAYASIKCENLIYVAGFHAPKGQLHIIDTNMSLPSNVQSGWAVSGKKKRFHGNFVYEVANNVVLPAMEGGSNKNTHAEIKNCIINYVQTAKI